MEAVEDRIPSTVTRKGNKRMASLEAKRVWTALAVVAMVLPVSACTSSPSSSTSATKALDTKKAHAPVTIEMWTFSHKQNQLDADQAALDALHAKYSWLTVHLVGNKSDSDFAKAATAGNPPDIMFSPSTQYLDSYAHSGSVADLTNLIKTGSVNIASTVLAPANAAMMSDGKQYALPLTGDAYVLYYNKKAFAAAGIAAPPKTMSELTADAKKLTIKKNGKISQFGFIPNDAYDNNQTIYQGVYSGTHFYGDNGAPTQATDPNWGHLLAWDKSLIDYYGAGVVDKFVAQYNPHSEDAGNPFGTGAVAMEFNGEWHTAQLKLFTPKLDYGTAPMPVLDGQTNSSTGVADVEMSPVYVAAKSKHIPEAFLATEYLTTDTATVDNVSTAFGAVPTTTDALKSWSLASDPHFAAIIAGFQNAGSYGRPVNLTVGEDATAWNTFIGQYESGKAKAGDLASFSDKLKNIVKQSAN
jgi:multiple sugar transport system substrate-binding protein